MPSIARGEASTSSDPILDLYIEDPSGVRLDPAVLEFRIFDISTALKRATPVQVYPAVPGDWAPLTPGSAPPAGHRLETGHFYAPWVVPTNEAIGDHEIEWRFKLTAPDEYELAAEEFYVAEAHTPHGYAYTSVADLRREGFTQSYATDDRINFLAKLATLYIDKMTGRWFVPRVFGAANRLKLNGNDSRVLFLDIPVIRLDALYLESQGVVAPDLTEIDLSAVRVYNRHLSGLTQPDDREMPQIAFVPAGRINETVVSGLYGVEQRAFTLGHLNVHLEGVFGYTDPDGTAFGCTPELIRQVATRLVARDLRLDSDSCEKLVDKNKFRIIGDKEGNHSVTLQPLWLKGAFTGDPEIDQVLMAYRRPVQIGVV